MLERRYSAFIILLSLYIFFNYGLERDETWGLFIVYTLLFFTYLWIFLKAQQNQIINFWIVSSLIIRASLLFTIPNLSDDFYRFLWDGQLLNNGYHPFSEIPSYYPNNKITWEGVSLYSHLNSPDYFTIYPPLAQYTFWLAIKLWPHSLLGSIVTLRLFALLAEAGTLWLMSQLLKQFGLPKKNILLYALNPLVILELTGNLHHESILIFFVLLSVYLILQQKIWLAAVPFSFAIGIKLIPLIFLPILVRRLEWKKAILFSIVTIICTVLLFLPLLKVAIILGYTQSIGYYFNKFEFNASIFYVVRGIGYLFQDFNTIVYVGKYMGVAAGLFILLYSFTRKNIKINNSNPVLFNDFSIILTIYFAFALTLHPWYVTSLLAFSIFTTYRFPISWTYMIFLTYVGYTKDSFQENYILTLLEYLVVLGHLSYEVYYSKKMINS